MGNSRSFAIGVMIPADLSLLQNPLVVKFGFYSSDEEAKL